MTRDEYKHLRAGYRALREVEMAGRRRRAVRAAVFLYVTLFALSAAVIALAILEVL